jgi:hypothetical protein
MKQIKTPPKEKQNPTKGKSKYTTKSKSKHNFKQIKTPPKANENATESEPKHYQKQI